MKIVKLWAGPIRVEGRLFDAPSVLALEDARADALVFAGAAEYSTDPWAIRNHVPKEELDKLLAMPR